MTLIRPPRRGVIVLSEGTTATGEPIETLLYLIPGTTHGMTTQQVVEAPSEIGAAIMEAWFRTNFRLAANSVELQVALEPWSTISSWLNLAFYDPRTGGSNESHRAVVERLTAEGPVWVPKTSDDPELLRLEAIQALNVFQAEFQQRAPARGAIGHNKPPEPLDDQLLDREQHRLALELVDRIRSQLSAEKIDRGAVAESAQTVISFIGRVASWFAAKGDVAATEFAKMVGKAGGAAAVAAVGTVAVAASTGTLTFPSFSSLGEAALRLIRALQALAGF